MDMKVDSKLIRSEREQRAWSQEHLAEVTGLGLRTIQRIETTGAASYESVRALAAVLEVDVARLRVAESPAADASAANEPRVASELAPTAPGRRSPILRPARVWRRPLYGMGALLATAGVALIVGQSVFADPILLDVGISRDGTNGGRQVKTQIVAEEGEIADASTVPFANELRFEIVPTIEADGGIMLATKIFVRSGDDYVLVTSPRLKTASGEEAGIVVTTDDGKSFEFSITPHSHPRELPKQLREWR